MAERDRAIALSLDAFRAGRFEEAAEMLRGVACDHPADAEALHLCGLALSAHGDHEGALRAMADCIRLGETASRRSHLGRVLDGLGRHAEALTQHARALDLAPDDFDALSTMGQSLQSAKKGEEAVEVFRRAIVLRPGSAEAWSNLGYALRSLGRDREALDAYEAVLEADPLGDTAHRTAALSALGRHGEAAAVGRRAAERSPSDPAVHVALGGALRAVDDFDGAEAAARRALELRPGHVVGHNNLAVLLLERGRPAEALAVLDRAEALDPDDAETRHNRALVLFDLRRWEDAWAPYEWRLRTAQARGAHGAFTGRQVWRGEPAPGRTLLVAPEQGAGDMIQFVRFVPLLAERGLRVVLGTYPPLQRLFATVPGVERLVTTAEEPPHTDLHCWMLSLPGLFGTRPDMVPATAPYLRADLALAAAWRPRVEGPGLKVGMAWAGNPNHLNDRRRSIPFDALAPLWAVPGVSWFSLQIGPRANDLAAAHVPVADLAPALGDFADTAAAIEALDLIVTVDTAVAHLAGALGRPVWTLLPAEADWRWSAAAATTPWYPTMRLFRRGRNDGGWRPAVSAVARVLAGFAAGP